MRKEPTIRAELYRVLKNSVEQGVSLGDYKVSDVAVEYSVNDKKADLVIFYHYIPRPANNAFLVIETKGRRIHPAPSLAGATKQVISYAEKLASRFFAVYDGWNFLLFKTSYPYLIRLSNFLHVDELIARNLLLGLLELNQTGHKTETLERLPKIPDAWSFHRSILPSIAKSLALLVETASEADYGKLLEAQWFPIVQRDGE